MEGIFLKLCRKIDKIAINLPKKYLVIDANFLRIDQFQILSCSMYLSINSNYKMWQLIGIDQVPIPIP